uniref:hypothetical protein n=1 Tax=Coprococcus sp. TaxID=2049024 RepID=UPI004025A702
MSDQKKQEKMPQIKTVAGHIIGNEIEKTEEHTPENVLDVNEHMSEKEKIHLMTKQQKRAYIMEYYAPKILFAFVIVGIVAFLVVKFFTTETEVLNIVAVNTNGRASDADEKAYYKDFLVENGYNTKKECVNINTGIGVSTDPDDTMSQQSLSLIQSKFMANSVDIFFADTELVLSLGEFGYMQNLDTVLSAKMKEYYKNSFVYATVLETGERIPVGIKIQNNPWLQKTGWYTGDVAVGFGDNAKHMDLALKFLEYIQK